VIDSCLGLTPEQQATTFPGTYGSILDTLRHLVGSDSWYLLDITCDPARRIDEKSMGLHQLRDAMEADGPAWSALLGQGRSPEEIVTEIDEEDGYERDAPIGLRLAQALHHGTDHRSQICTALTSLGLEPPSIDAWTFGVDDGSITERYPTT
jgi:uncharacterized damage-inducible protein DinB